jgi:mevalonate kinase
MKNSNISYSTPVAFSLIGEEGFLYGKPVLVMSSNKKVMVTLTVTSTTELNDANRPINDVVKNFLTKKEIPFKEQYFEVKIKSGIEETYPGYRAAVTVSLVAALLELYTGKEFDQATINQLAYAVEKKTEKNRYGFYTSCSAFGGLLYARKEFEFLRSFSQLNFKIPKNIQDNLYILHRPGSFEESSSYMKNLYNNDHETADSLLNKIEKCTKRVVVSLIKEDKNMFQGSLSDYQNLLNIKSEFSVVFSEDILEEPQYTRFVLSETGVQRVK